MTQKFEIQGINSFIQMNNAYLYDSVKIKNDWKVCTGVNAIKKTVLNIEAYVQIVTNNMKLTILDKSENNSENSKKSEFITEMENISIEKFYNYMEQVEWMIKLFLVNTNEEEIEKRKDILHRTFSKL